MSGFDRKPVESSRAFDTPSGAESRAFFDLANERHYSVIELAKLGRSVNEQFGACSKANRGFSAGEVPSVDSKEDTRRCAFPRQSCYGCIAGYALRAEIPRVEFARLQFT